MASVQEVAVGCVFAATIVSLYLRPFGPKDWQVAGAGGIAAWALSPLGLDGGWEVVRESWNILLFFLGLMLLAAGAEACGLYALAARLLQRAGGGRCELVAVLALIVGAVLIATMLANLLNNWPSVLLIAATIGASGHPSDALLAGALIGSTIGANLTLVGALSTVFWLTLARKEGARYSPGMYARRAFMPTLAAVSAACVVVAVV